MNIHCHFKNSLDISEVLCFRKKFPHYKIRKVHRIKIKECNSSINKYVDVKSSTETRADYFFNVCQLQNAVIFGQLKTPGAPLEFVKAVTLFSLQFSSVILSLIGPNYMLKNYFKNKLINAFQTTSNNLIRGRQPSYFHSHVIWQNYAFG